MNERAATRSTTVGPLPDTIAIIPARGGSKGIPHKNLVPLNGVPLLAHTIEQALATPAIGRVFVSTDDEEIAEVSIRWRAEVIHRPPELSGDEATSESALIHALEQLEETEGYEPELLAFLQATSPLRQPSDIQMAIETLVREEADSLFSACHVHGFVWRRRDGDLRSISYDFRRRRRRQRLGEDLLENGSIYLVKPPLLRQENNRLGGKIAVHLMDPLYSLQIDEPEDLEILERLFALDARASRER